MKNKILLKFQKLDFLAASLSHAVSGFSVGSRSGRQVVTICDGRTDGRTRHSHEGCDI